MSTHIFLGEQLSSLIKDCRQVSQESGQGIQLANADVSVKSSLVYMQELTFFLGGGGGRHYDQLSDVFVQHYQNPSSWRLTRIDEHGMNEIVEYRVQGVISDKLLPPIGALK